jgi:hypothetical protein
MRATVPVLVTALAAVSGLAAGCWARSTAVEAQPLGGVVLLCEPRDASLFVDDKYLGSVRGLRDRPLNLPVGTHRIEISKPGYFPHYAEVQVAQGVRERLEVTLRKEPF